MFYINTVQVVHFLAEQANQVYVALMNEVGVSVSSIGFMVLCLSVMAFITFILKISIQASDGTDGATRISM